MTRSTSPFEQHWCPDCGGSGWNFTADHDCERCAGEGLLYTPEALERRIGERDLGRLLNPSDERIAELRAMPYAEYLYSPEWRQRRAMHIRMADFRCDSCGIQGSYGTLQVHHKSYGRFGREDLGDLEVLCVSCHRSKHGIRE